MAMRFGPLVALLSVFVSAFGAYPVLAQGSGADQAPYPMQADEPAAVSAAKPAAKPATASKPAPKAVPAPAAKIETPKSTAAARPASSEPEPAVAAFAGVPRDERLKLQAALLWSGDYTGAVDGEDPMLTAIKNFQKRKKAKVTGVLAPRERSELMGAAREHEEEFGWSVVADPATGIRIGLPAKLVPHVQEASHGTRWSSGHGEVQVETFRLVGPDLKLPALFEQEKTSRNRKVEYSLLRDDNFFVSGLQGLRKFSVRAQMRDGEVRGFTMLFDQAMEGIVAPVAVAMASAFSPFPQHGAPFASLSRPVEYGNGLIVSAQGHIVTGIGITHGCRVIVAAGLGDAEPVAEDRNSGLALLRVYGPRRFKALALPPDAATAAGAKAIDVVLAGIPDPKESNGRGALAEIKARLSDGNSIELRQSEPMAGFSGAAALDARGRFLGMTEMRHAVLASIEPAAPPLRLVKAQTIAAFLERHGLRAGPDAAGDARDSIVRIICVRK